jgi:WD40 repeat protein
LEAAPRCQFVLKRFQAGNNINNAVSQVEEALNLSEKGDLHVSFVALKLRLSPDFSHLLICTDGPRLLVYNTQSMRMVSAIYGLHMDTFHVPCACWHPSGCHVYTAEPSGEIFAYHVGTGQKVGRVLGHTKSVRGMLFRRDEGVQAGPEMVTCGFDKTILAFSAPRKDDKQA